MFCHGCGYDGEPGPKHAKRHWTRQRAKVRDFRAEYGASMTWRMGLHGKPRACTWTELCLEAESVYDELLAKVRG